MKRSLLILGFILFSSVVCKAQYIGLDLESKFGFKLGGSMSMIKTSSFDPYFSTTSVISPLESFVGGLVAELKGKESLNGFQIELLYKRSGARIVEQNGDVNRIQMDQFYVPFIAKFKMNKYLYLTVGAYIQAQFGAKYFKGLEKSNILGELKTLDKGLLCGIESHFESGAFVDLRYNVGFTNLMIEDNSLTNPDNSFIFNRMIDLTIGYRL